ncbi:family 78 glycoside hydrolase catalytic domain [Anaerobium acetethylicum]|uniref:alpha-L-rhamnosidase n=1 Tax=Anaerobium acetethylicum TaxID=1619234 RepID=A0A1D3TSY8_9FIRM|nr:family 78 glycoside hydrolase catalytic domain [Anaerobium acetethylicum]SCP96994.1 alpha-L-rhamnosidase [Anaerobium acetethylicum]
MLKIDRITVENLERGCVTDHPHPRISFSLESDGHDVELKRAKVSVGDWTAETADQAAIPYEGKALLPFTGYEVNVAAEDNHGERAEAAVFFETGRLGTPWHAEWITDREYHFTEKKASPKTMTFRKTVSIDRPVKKAQIYSTAIGIYELMLNGKKVGEDYFAPGYTSYKSHLQYQVYDVTSQVGKQNQVMAVVGGGWAVGAFNYKRVNRAYADRQAFMMELRVTYEDGTTEVFGTDETWEVTEDGNYRFTEFYAGETYDATVELEKLAWRKAGIEKLKIHPEIKASYGAMVRAHEEFRPISCTKAPSGMLIYDFGQNFAGVIRAVIRGKKGQEILFHHAEVLMDGELFTKPLRSALQQARYICTEGEQTYSPRMTYMGFRYSGVEGIREEDLELTAIALYSDLEQTGTFSCSNALVNKLQDAIVWGAKSNFVDIPTDCPQRDERMGWTGDIAVFAPTAAYNFNMGRFLEKWLLDVKAEQRPGGGIPMVVPNSTVPMQWELMIPMAVDHWGDACIWVPWAEYQARGDIQILRDMYPVMKNYLKACRFWAELFSVGKRRRIWRLLHHYGDWCAPNVSLMGWMSRGKWTATAALARSAANVAEIAEILGEKEDAAYYEKLSAETADAYRSLLMDKDCRIRNEFQTGYVLPLHYRMLDAEDQKKTAANLVEMVRKNGYHIATGFPGTPYILFALADNGYMEDAFKMLLTDTCPSWLYEVKAGGTTIWERWDALREDGTCNTGEDDGTGGMVSFNHYASGSVGAFLYEKIAGIQPLKPGYKEFAIRPLIGGDITSARGTLRTPYGEIISDWRLEGKQFCISIQVPVGTTCRLELPDGTVKVYGSGWYENR